MGGGIVTYRAPEIAVSSRRDTGFGWLLHMVSVAKAGASNLEGTEVPGSISRRSWKDFRDMFMAHSPRVEREARERSKRLREWGGGL